MILPVDFRQKVAMPPAVNGNGYPYGISAEDLMRNFIFAAIDVESEQTEPITLQITTVNGVRKISILLDPPSTGTYVLGSVDGEAQWIATEECV